MWYSYLRYEYNMGVDFFFTARFVDYFIVYMLHSQNKWGILIIFLCKDCWAFCYFKVYIVFAFLTSGYYKYFPTAYNDICAQ